MATAQVTVRGAGIFGLSVAYACALRGAQVTVVDPNGVGAGSSGGLVGALAPHVPEQWNDKKAFQLDSLLMQERYWSGVEERSGMPTGYARTGRLQPLADDAAVALATDRAAGAETLWRGKAAWRVIDADLAAWTVSSPTGKLVHDTLSGLVHPRMATVSLAAAVQSLEGQIVTEAPDQGLVVWSTGWQGLDEMTAQHRRQVGNGVKGQAALLDYDASGLPQLFANGVHMIPHLDGTVAVGSTTEREFDDPTATDTQLDEVIDKARAAVPALANAPVTQRWAGVRLRSRTRAPMLGHHPFRAGEFVANGGFKIGFGMAPKMGEVMADLILNGDDTIPDGFKAEANL